jgi:hypothetical protein
LNESTLGRQERRGIDYRSRPHFVLLLGLSFLGLVSGSSLATLAAASGLTATTRILAAATRIFATAGSFAAVRLAAVLLAAVLAENAVQQTDAATLLAAGLLAADFAATSRIFTAAARIFAAASGLFTAVVLAAALGAAVLLAVKFAEQVQQRGPAAFLAAGLLATRVATASRILATATRILAAASRIFTAATRIFATADRLFAAIAVAAALLALLATSEEVQQRCPAALRLAGHARIASSIAAAAGSWILTTRCVTTARLVTAAVVVRSEHSVE